jgi:energy-coupling factor transporter ATP-binding protein EcfA2
MAESSGHSSKGWETFRLWAEWISGGLVVLHLIAGVWDTWNEHGKLAEIFRPRPIAGVGTGKIEIAVVLIAALVWALARFPRLRFGLSRIFFGKSRAVTTETPLLFRGLQPYRTGEQLPGRRVDGERCTLLLGEQEFLVLEGESGCGKSSLLNAILLPKASELFRTVRVRLADEPYAATIRALQGLDGPKETWSADAQGIAKAVSELAAQRKGRDHESGGLEKPLLLCIDQFEELFGSVSDQVRRDYMEALRKAIAAGELRLLIVTRIDFSDLLVNLCREVDPSGAAFTVEHFYVLKPFRKDQALWVLKEIFAPIISDDEEFAAEFGSFEETLVCDLLQPPRDRRLSREDEKTVLPAELQMVGQMIESLGADQFTSKSFREHGGRKGLLNLYVEQAKNSVARMGVPGDKALLILRQLVPTGRARVARSARSISETLSLPPAQVTRALEAFMELKLVNPVPKSSDPEAGDQDGMRYELMHEHLAQVLRDAGDPALQEARETEESLRFWRDRAASQSGGAQGTAKSRVWGGVTNAFAQPIPILEALLLLRRANRPDRGMLLASIRGFFLRLMLIVVPAILLILWTRSNAYQIHEVISKGVSLNLEPAAIIDVTNTGGGLYQGAEATAEVMDDWVEALHTSGNDDRGRKQVEESLDRLNQRADTKSSALYSGVILNIEDGKILSWTGKDDQAGSRFDAAQGILSQICADHVGYQSAGLCFVGEARLAEARARTAKTSEQSGQAAKNWRAAFDAFGEESSYGVPIVPVDVGQFTITIRNIDKLKGVEPKIREELWDKAVEIVSKSYIAPNNCIILSEIAYELHKEGKAEKAAALWQLAKETAAHFSSPAAPKPIPPAAPGKWDDAEPQIPRFHGLLIETYNNDLVFDRCRVLLYLGAIEYRAGEKDAALKSWREYLDLVGKIQPAPSAPAPYPTPSSDIPQENPPNPYLNEPPPLMSLGEFGRIIYMLRTPPPPAKGNSELNAISIEAEGEVAEFAQKRTGPCWQCVVELAASAWRLAGLDETASNQAWGMAMTAAKELQGPRGPAGAAGARYERRNKIESNTQSPALEDMESALPQSDPALKAQVFPFMALLLIKHGKLDQSLDVTNAITGEEGRQWSLEQSAQTLIDSGTLVSAKRVVGNINDETFRTGNDNMRPVWIASAVTLESQLGLFRQARQLCELSGETSAGRQVACLKTIVENYEARKNESLRAQYAERDSRETLEWWGVIPRY